MCVACSTPLPAGSLFCPRCGARQPETSPAAPDGSLLPTPPPPPAAFAPPPGAYAPPGTQPALGSYGYAAPPAQAPTGTNGFAIASFVLSFFFCFYAVPSILAVIFGHVARGQIRRTGQQGGGLALAGLIIGYVGIALMALLLVLVIAAGDDVDSGH
jgi:hypothetical protein